VRNTSPLSAKEKKIHEEGLVTVLKDLHDELDAAVADAYGWPVDLTDDEILERLVRLNAERAAEEEKGHIRWLRPDYQRAKAGLREQTLGLDTAKPAEPAKRARSAQKKLPWPKRTSDRIQAVRDILAESATSQTPKHVAAHFSRAKVADVADMLATLAVLGHIQTLDDGSFSSPESA
jgi:hypothetical protein